MIFSCWYLLTLLIFNYYILERNACLNSRKTVSFYKGLMGLNENFTEMMFNLFELLIINVLFYYYIGNIIE